MKKLAGFSIYVSNSSRVPSGKRCYHHEGKDYPELYQDVTCDAIGKYITVIVTRPPETPSGEICYTSYAVLELCEVDVHGKDTGCIGIVTIYTVSCRNNYDQAFRIKPYFYENQRRVQGRTNRPLPDEIDSGGWKNAESQ